MSNDARITDTSTHGGAIITGASSFIDEGQPTARIGDILLCPAHGPVPLVTGSAQMLVEGSPTSRIGDVAACGAVICSGAQKLVIGG